MANAIVGTLTLLAMATVVGVPFGIFGRDLPRRIRLGPGKLLDPLRGRRPERRALDRLGHGRVPDPCRPLQDVLGLRRRRRPRLHDDPPRHAHDRGGPDPRAPELPGGGARPRRRALEDDRRSSLFGPRSRASSRAIIIALARIAGETAPLLFTALGNNFWNHNLKEPISALPLQIFAYAISPYDDWHRQAWAGALVLMALILALNITVRVFSRDRKDGPLNTMSTLPEVAGRDRGFRAGSDLCDTRPRTHGKPSGRRGGGRIRHQELQPLVRAAPGAPGRHDPHPGQEGDGHHRPERLRQVDLPSGAQPDARADAGHPSRGIPAALWRGPLRAGGRGRGDPPPGRHGLPEVQSVPDDVHRGERARRPSTQRRARQGRAATSASSSRCGWPPCGTR